MQKSQKPSKFHVPTQLSEAPRPDPLTTLDGRTDVQPAPTAPAPTELADQPGGVTTEQMQAEVARQTETLQTQFAEQRQRDLAQARRTSTILALQTHLNCAMGEDLGAVQFQNQIHGIIAEVNALSDLSTEKAEEVLSKARELQEARAQQFLAEHQSPSADLPSMGGQAARGGEGDRFSPWRYMDALARHIGDVQLSLDGENLSGAPELEYASELLGKSDWGKRAYQALSSQADRQSARSRVVPIPLASLRPEVVFAETYSDAANLRQPTYRRDALVPFFRPPNVLAGLGVPMPMTSNDLTLPRLSASLAAAWRPENMEIPDASITVTPITTSPKRLGVRDDISWMLLAGGDAQFGIQGLVVQEMANAVMQAKEAAVYGAANANGPTGIRGTTGISSKDLGTTDPTYMDILNMVTVIANKSIPVDMGKFLINPTIRELLSMTQKFAAGGATVMNDTAFRESDAGMADPGAFGARPAGVMAGGYPAYSTTHIPIEGSGDTYMYFGIWNYVWCLDYSVAFLTIDDISQAASGRTRITVNSYHDVAHRFPAAFNVVTHDTTV